MRGNGSLAALIGMLFAALADGQWSDDACAGTTCRRFDPITNKCVESAGDYYDLSSLKAQGLLGGQSFPDLKVDGVNYYLSVCRPVEAYVNDQAMVQTCKNQGDAAGKAVGWQYTKNSDGSFSCVYLGLPASGGGGEVKAYSRGVPLGPYSFSSCDADVCVRYSKGDQAWGCTHERSVTYAISCGESTLPSVFETNPGSCQYLVKFSHPSGCKVQVMSWGWWFDFVFFALVTNYVGFGVAYKVKKKGYSLGVEAIPNIEFWRSVRGYVRDGVDLSRERLKPWWRDMAGRVKREGGYNEMA